MNGQNYYHKVDTDMFFLTYFSQDKEDLLIFNSLVHLDKMLHTKIPCKFELLTSQTDIDMVKTCRTRQYLNCDIFCRF